MCGRGVNPRPHSLDMTSVTQNSQLPIEAFADEIRQAIERSRVVVVSGDTGSGKTTRLPRICLEAGCGRRGRIAVTQPRRLACVAMATRVAEESGCELGDFVGFRHRFEKKVSRQTVVEFMTDGMLLADTRSDPRLAAYDTIIIDEAHERSLNIDFLLGVLKRILKRRKDLRVIISSATMDVARFSEFFDGAPVISVPGRLFPIETRWEDGDEEGVELPRRIADAVQSLIEEGRGDILVFLPGERDIRETGEVLSGRRFSNTDIIPLTASLPAGEQRRAFVTSSRRRIILATNVAETSVTLPGIHCVIDSGLARIKRYNPRTRVQRLQIEPISRASAEQRRGRCGRTGPGVCVRLYSQRNFESRDPYTPPEVLRSPLAGVILSMLDLQLGAVEDFPFLDAPPQSLIRNGYAELYALGAICETGDPDFPWRLTPLGKKLASLPLDPAVGRAIFAADREGMLPELLVIAAALSCDDPRRRPMEERERADAMHARFLCADSDFLAILKLWNWYHAPTAQTRQLSPFAPPSAPPPSQSALRRLCKENYLSYPKMRQWQELHAQLEERCIALGLRNSGISRRDDIEKSDALHRALLAGMVTRIGKRDPQSGEYRGTHSTVFSIFPGSGLAKKKEVVSAREKDHGGKPKRTAPSREWILAADLVDTSRLFARTAACIRQEWIEPAAAAICKYSHYSPEWDEVHGFVRVRERVVLQGLTVVDGRLRDASKIMPAQAREIFIRFALVQAQFPRPQPRFLIKNAALRDRLLDEEAKRRMHGAIYDEDQTAAFYDRVLPADINNAAALRRWIAARGGDDDLILSEPARKDNGQWPDFVMLNGVRFPLSYKHAPGAEDDGVTCHVPAGAEAALASWRHEWLVPGMLDEKLNWMLTALPGKIRRLLVPIGDTLARLRTRLVPGRGCLADEVASALYEITGIKVNPEIWNEDVFPPHLRIHFDYGKRRPREPEKKEVRRAVLPEDWNLPDSVEVGSAGWKVRNVPALKLGNDGEISIENFADAQLAAAEHEKAVIALIARSLGKTWKRLIQPPRLDRSLTLYLATLETSPARLGEDLALGATRAVFIDASPPLRSARALKCAVAEKQPLLASMLAERTSIVLDALRSSEKIERLVQRPGIPAESAEDILGQLVWMLPDGFARNTPSSALREYPRYFQAILKRIERAGTNPSGDLDRLARFAPYWQRYESFFDLKPRPRYDAARLAEYRWMLEEFRVSLFAQELRTAYPVSAKRLDALWSKVVD